MMAGLKHKNIVQFKGYCIHAEKRFMVHEFVQNNSLAEALFGNTLNYITKLNENIKEILGHYEKCKLLKSFLKQDVLNICFPNMW
jgi:hypothetical protein